MTSLLLVTNRHGSTTSFDRILLGVLHLAVLDFLNWSFTGVSCTVSYDEVELMVVCFTVEACQVEECA